MAAFRTICRLLAVGLLFGSVAGQLPFSHINLDHIINLQNKVRQGKGEGLFETVEEEQDRWKTVPVNIAVIGQTGAGKSSVINAFIRLTADDEGAAEVGVMETTKTAENYKHPNNPQIMFWDIPGAGTNNFPIDTYLQQIRVDRYDCFILVTSTRFTENDIWLAKKIRRLDKPLYYVRNKVGRDIESDKRSHPRTHDECKLTEQMKQETLQLIETSGANGPLFLIDTFDQHKYDFRQLEQRIITDLPELQRKALLFTTPASDEDLIFKKYEELRGDIWKYAAMSAAVAIVPIPYVSVAFDTGLIIQQSLFYAEQLGLVKATIHKEKIMNLYDLVSLLSMFIDECGEDAVSGLFQSRFFKLSTQFHIEGAVKENVRFAAPFAGNAAAAAMSYGTTYSLLYQILNNLKDASIRMAKTGGNLNSLITS